jgi:hypothetical protein
VDNAPLTDPGANLTLDGTGAATYTLNTTTLSSGGHTISATYAGNTALAGSKGTVGIDVVSTSQRDFALTPCQAASSAKSGSTASGITLTLTPFNGFTGAVNLTATAQTPVATQFSFSANPVNITGGAVTTTLTISAFQSNARTGGSQITTAHHDGSGKLPWYAAGSGATLACILLVGFPRRRRLGALLMVVLSAGVFTAAGCGGGTSSAGSSGSTTPTVTNATAGTYNVTVTAVSGGVVHSTVITLTVN